MRVTKRKSKGGMYLFKYINILVSMLMFPHVKEVLMIVKTTKIAQVKRKHKGMIVVMKWKAETRKRRKRPKREGGRGSEGKCRKRCPPIKRASRTPRKTTRARKKRK